MQKRLSILGVCVLLIISNSIIAQTFYVCNNSEVIFEMADDYWGEPIFEYSTDSLIWEEVNVNLNEPFTVNIGMSGYYRLRMMDAECDSSYVSEVKLINVPSIEITLNSFFSGFEIPSSTNPFLWLAGDNTVSDVQFVVNGEITDVEGTGGYLENPGDSFDVYATAFHPESGCSFKSDTLSFVVFDPNETTNVIFDLSGNFNLDEISVSSEIDSMALMGDPNFSIDYSSAIGIDFLYAYSSNIVSDSQLVAIQAVQPGLASITMDIESTSTTWIMLHPDLALNIYEASDEMTSLIEASSGLSVLVAELQENLDILGHLDLGSENVEDIRNSVVDEILFEIESGLVDNLDGELNHPTVTINEYGALTYLHQGISSFYAVRAYLGETAVSESILFFGNQNLTSSVVAKCIVNKLVSISDEWQVALTTHPRGVNNSIAQLSASDIELSGEEGYQEFILRITNGSTWADDGEFEVKQARYLNYAYMVTNLVLAVPSLIAPFLKFGASLTAGLIDTLINSFNTVQASPDTSLSDVLGLMASFAGIVMTIIVVEAELSVGVVVAIAACMVPALVSIGYSVHDYYFGSEKDFTYLLAKAGNKLSHRLKLETNAADSFVGVPGSKTITNPSISLMYREKAIYDFYFSDEGEELILGEWEDYPYLSSFDLNGSLIGLESITKPDGTENIELEFVDYPLEGGEQIFEMVLAWQQGAESPELGIDLTVDGNPVNGLEGYPDSGLTFTASVEQPVLNIGGYTSQIGEPESIVSHLQAQLWTSATEQHISAGYPVKFQVIEGDGEIRQVGASTWVGEMEMASSLLSVYSFVGPVEWRFGQLGPQSVKAYIVNPQTQEELTSVIFEGTAYDCPELEGNFEDDCDDGNPDTSETEISEYCECISNSECGELPPGTVCNPSTGRIWMDRNLGASQVATGPYDSTAYGGYYQWGRATTSFTIGLNVFPQDWSIPQNDNLWQGVNGINNCCPEGYRIPTSAEWDEERLSWSSNNAEGAFGSPLNLTAAGKRDAITGAYITPGIHGGYWSSTVSGVYSSYLYFNSNTSVLGLCWRGYGRSVRCIRD